MDSQTKYPTRFPVSIEYGGKRYEASYHVANEMVTLSSEWGSKSARVGRSTAEFLARIMLREELDAAKGRGDL